MLRVAVVLVCATAILCETITTNAGSPVDDGTNSQTAGDRGPILLQDQLLVERLAIHNRERIPERNVHARGAMAKGYFRTTQNWMSEYTFAKFLQANDTTTPLACRFSTVIHSKGSPEFLRDPRGFALKLYTEEGNYDIVGLNFPIFFIRDGIRFPDMIRALKPNPVNGQQEWWRIWDFFSNYPESAHMFTWLMDDVGIPASYREQNGWGIHTYKWISSAGKETFVRYYYLSAQGVHSLNDTDATAMPFSFATEDLFDNIQKGNYPKWTVMVQTLDPDNTSLINSLTFDPLDTTKQWPEDIFPMREIGYFEFNENPISQFLEMEQIAFSPAHMVPGIEPSDEKMLQTRLFSYGDTQRYRLGVNYQMLPINKPKCPFMDNHLDGEMNFLQESTLSAKEVNYYPSKTNTTMQQAKPYYHEQEEVVNGKKIRQMISKTDDFEQPGKRYESFDGPRQDRLAKRIAMTLTGERLAPVVKTTWMGYWQSVNTDLARKIEEAVNEVLMAEGRMPGGDLMTAQQKGDILKFKADFFRAQGGRA